MSEEVFSVGERVRVRATGEQMTVRSVWPGIVFLTFRTPSDWDWICAPCDICEKSEIVKEANYNSAP